jgi:hypothetical protein
MGVTVIGGSSQATPTAFRAPVVERKAKWADSWQVDREITVQRLALYASSTQVSSATITRRYGHLKQPYETTLTNKAVLDINGHWIRISIFNGAGTALTVLFVGQVDDQARLMQGQDGAPSGSQTWVVSNPLCTLRKTAISQAYFLEGSSLRKVGWVPPMNSRDKRGLVAGNRSAGAMGLGSTFCYGGLNLWTHKQYVEYLLANFVEQPGGPRFTLAGQADVLAGLQTTIHWGTAPTAARMLSELIPPRYGVDWYLAPTPAGFEVRVFALGTANIAFGNTVMPKNPNTVQVRKNNQKEMIEVHIVESVERKCDKIEVVGKRIVVCGTLNSEVLVPKWTAAEEALYLAPDGGTTTDPLTLDEMRKSEALMRVWCAYGAPDNWNHASGAWCVSCKDDGSFTSGAAAAGPNTPQYQTTIRDTLSWIPLKVGYDYAQAGAATDPLRNLDGSSELRPLTAWIGLVTDVTGKHVSGRRYLCHEMGMSVHKPHMDWGVYVCAHPAHALALNVWTDPNWATSVYAGNRYSYSDLVVTLAMESDHRLRLQYSLPPSLAAGDGSVMTIEESDAEGWVVLPATTVDLTPSGTYTKTTSAGYLVMRDDRPRLALAMAGLLARYINDRVRASITLRGWAPWGELLGSILDVVEQGDDLATVGAPITSLEWVLTPSPITVLKTGYA